MKKINTILGLVALMLIPSVTSCDDAAEGISYTAINYPFGQGQWRSDVSADDRAVISEMINNMVLVENCQFFMGAQNKSIKRANYSSLFTSRDTIWYRQGVGAYWRPTVNKANDTVWYNAGDFHFLDTIKSKYDTVPYTTVATNAMVWVGPVTEVSMPDYYIGKYEVTQRQWMAVMHRNPSGYHCKIEGLEPAPWYEKIGMGDNVAAYNIWYQDAVAFCDSLSALTGLQFRLPTEAEWECAARGGRYTHGYRYPGSDNSVDAGWNYNNACVDGLGSEDYGVHAVGEKLPNELGLYDMSGNVSEWVSNAYYKYGATDSINPQGRMPRLDGKDTLIHRGGSWDAKLSKDLSPAGRKYCIMSSYSSEESRQSAFRNCGFRLCISAK